VTDVDLFIPVLTFVFGEATLDGDVAVVSTARLADENGDRYLAARLAKESVHELGHTFGLIHCGDARCAMARSASLAHVDVKRAALCGDCRVRLRERQLRGGETS
jgi:archaemetzincin